MALWTAWHIGAFCRAAYHGKAYPTLTKVLKQWEDGKREARKEPVKPGQEPWRIHQAWMRQLAKTPKEPRAKRRRNHS